MRIANVYRREQIAPYITVVSEELSARDALVLVDYLGKESCLLEPLPQTSQFGVATIYKGDDQVEVDFRSCSTRDFEAFYKTIDPHAYESTVRGVTTQGLISLLRSQQISPDEKTPKDDLVRMVVEKPQVLFRCLATNVRGVVHDVRMGRVISLENPQTSRTAVPILSFNVKKAPGDAGRVHLDFWQLEWEITVKDKKTGEEKKEPRKAEFSVESRPEDLEAALHAAPKGESLVLNWRLGKAPQVSFGDPTLDIEDMTIQDMKREFGAFATNTREGTIQNVVLKKQDDRLLAKLDGKRIYFSQGHPVLIGQPMTRDELLCAAPHVRLVTSSDGVFEGLIQADYTAKDFVDALKAGSRLWAVFADLRLARA